MSHFNKKKIVWFDKVHILQKESKVYPAKYPFNGKPLHTAVIVENSKSWNITKLQGKLKTDSPPSKGKNKNLKQMENNCHPPDFAQGIPYVENVVSNIQHILAFWPKYGNFQCINNLWIAGCRIFCCLSPPFRTSAIYIISIESFEK